MALAANELGSAIVIDVENGWKGESELGRQHSDPWSGPKLCKRRPTGLATSCLPGTTDAEVEPSTHVSP